MINNNGNTKTLSIVKAFNCFCCYSNKSHVITKSLKWIPLANNNNKTWVIKYSIQFDFELLLIVDYWITSKTITRKNREQHDSVGVFVYCVKSRSITVSLLFFQHHKTAVGCAFNDDGFQMFKCLLFLPVSYFFCF